MQYAFRTAYPTNKERSRIKRAMVHIAASAGFFSTHQATVVSPALLLAWLADNAGLVIALIHAAREDAAETRQVLYSIGQKETST